MASDLDGDLVVLSSNSDSDDDFVPRKQARGRGKGKGRGASRGRRGRGRSSKNAAATAASTPKRRQPSCSSRPPGSPLDNISIVSIDTPSEKSVTSHILLDDSSNSNSGPSHSRARTSSTAFRSLDFSDLSDTQSDLPQLASRIPPQLSRQNGNELNCVEPKSNTQKGGTKRGLAKKVPSIDAVPQSTLDTSVDSDLPQLSSYKSVQPSYKSVQPTTQDENKADEEPKPSLVKRATKRGLAKKSSAENSTAVLPDTHDTHCIYSNQVSVFSRVIEVEGTAEMSDKQEKSSKIDADGYDNISNGPNEKKDGNEESQRDEKAESEKVAENCDDSEIVNEEGEDLLSPSPPPMPSVGRRGKRMNQKLTKALKALTKAKDALEKGLMTPTTPRRGGRRGRRGRGQENDIIYVETESPVNDEMLVKVRYLSKVHRFPMKMADQLNDLVGQLSDELSEAEHTLSLFLHDQPLNLNQTIRQAGITVADIIECYLIKPTSGEENKEDMIELCIQAQDRKTGLKVKTHRRQPLSDVMQQYAEKLKVAVGLLKFSFDGEEVLQTDTPFRLEMDDGDVIDVVVS